MSTIEITDEDGYVITIDDAPGPPIIDDVTADGSTWSSQRISDQFATLVPASLDDLADAGVVYAAHRGGASLAPENTMEAFRAAVAYGATALEFDCQILADGSIGIMHDTTVDRTTTGSGNVAEHSAASWANLTIDAASWFGGAFPSTLHPPTLDQVLREFGNKVVLIPEAKSTGTGAAIAAMLTAYAIDPDAVLVQGGDAELQPVLEAGYRTAILGDSLDPEDTAELGHTWVIHSSAASSGYPAAMHAVGIKTLVYSVDTITLRDTWVSNGVDGVITSDPIFVGGLISRYRRTTDPWKTAGTFYHGHYVYPYNMPYTAVRGTFVGSAGSYRWKPGQTTWGLMGWACPLANAAATYSITFTVTFDTVGSDSTRWAGVHFCQPTMNNYVNGGGSTDNGYLCMVRANGTLQLYSEVAGVSTSRGTASTSAITIGNSAVIRIDVTPTTVTITRTDSAGSVSYTDAAYRGEYFYAGVVSNATGLDASFSNITVA